MNTIHSISHAISDASLSLIDSGLTVTDTKTRDSVTITGLNRVQVAKEIRWWLDFYACSHDESDNAEMLNALQRMQTSLNSAIAKLSPETEEAAK